MLHSSCMQYIHEVRYTASACTVPLLKYSCDIDIENFDNRNDFSLNYAGILITSINT
jgi:hypothetical protein